ncbi:MAG: hypothetical protein RI988_3492 [Pseudomonadota bacterium]|jgi:uncharacterized protein (UPF0335 family)
MPEAGHNSVAADELKKLMDRIETLDDERVALGEQIRSVYMEAKAAGFDTKPIRKLVALRRRDRGQILEDKAMLELYASALGCLDLV